MGVSKTQGPKAIIQRDKLTPLFIAALFTITKTWRQPKCSSTDERIRKMWYVCIIEYYLAVKKEQNNITCSNMDAT